ncbi:MAG: polyprenyl synthetase family protein [Phycisphaerales bacterium]|nr:polyprenyl synthetase family protein [Planctomycetota bacterium]MBL6997520.1 polyprenyl synthetase family protein [Phycisphaerales bacterium]
MIPPSTDTPPKTLKDAAKVIETNLDKSLQASALPPHIYEAAQYAVVNGGKRVRPALTLLCAQAVGGTQDQAMAAAIAVEFIHCFSLVHDDLPAIDNDDLRRGKPTLHIHAGEAMAVLAGDLLLPLAFQELSRGNYVPNQQVLLMDELAQATRDMVVGQVYDTLGGIPEELSEQDALEVIHRNKTGALFKCACVMGSICGQANPKMHHAIEQFGIATGLMFQIVDDLIDLNGVAEHVGKATGKDAEAGKTTYPGLIGVEASIEAVSMLKDQADDALSVLGEQGETLRSFNLWMAHRTR